MIMNGPGGMSATTMTMPSQPRYRLGLSVNRQNLTITTTPAGFSGVQTSPLLEADKRF